MTDDDDYRPTPGFADLLRRRWIESGGDGDPASDLIESEDVAILRVAFDEWTMRILKYVADDKGKTVEALVASIVSSWVSTAKRGDDWNV
ncbi:MAG: hypothetical protein M3036_04535 [Bifidobacteriales bacterium]|nr:hypothetical protein [Bifidobacteriales bacterium]